MIIKVYHGPRYQRGQGLGSMFSSLFRRVIPFAKVAANVVKSSPLAREVGRTLKDTAINVAVDALEKKKDPDDSTLNNQLRNATVNLLKSQKSSQKRTSNRVKSGRAKKKRKTYSTNQPLFS